MRVTTRRHWQSERMGSPGPVLHGQYTGTIHSSEDILGTDVVHFTMGLTPRADRYSFAAVALWGTTMSPDEQTYYPETSLTSPLINSYMLLSWYLRPVAGSVYGPYNQESLVKDQSNLQNTAVPPVQLYRNNAVGAAQMVALR